ASLSSCSLTSRFASYSRSILALAASLALKKTSCAPRKRAQSASSSLREARGDFFHSAIRSRYLSVVGPHSDEFCKDSAREISSSLIFFASALRASSCEKNARRFFSKVLRAVRKRPQRASSVARDSRGPAFWVARH